MRRQLLPSVISGTLCACTGTSIQVRTPTLRPPDRQDPQGSAFSVQPALMANLTASPNPAMENRAVTFTASSSGSQGPTPINRYHMEFGDGDATTQRVNGAVTVSAQHAYAKAGAYIATITITITTGDTATVSTPITVTDH